MAIKINGKKLHKRKTPDYKINKVKQLLSDRKSVKTICTEAKVTAHTVRAVREGVY